MAAPSSVAPLSQSRKLLAPSWHTIVLILLLLGTSYFQSSRVGQLQSYKITNRMAVYSFTIFFELVLLAYVWFLGIRHTGTRFTDVVGGKWENAKDVWRDIGIAFLFWFVVAFFLVSLSHLLGKNTEMTKVAELIMPRSALELAVWILLSISAGFCEIRFPRLFATAVFRFHRQHTRCHRRAGAHLWRRAWLSGLEGNAHDCRVRRVVRNTRQHAQEPKAWHDPARDAGFFRGNFPEPIEVSS